jgi:hypothetical protein
MSARLEPLLSAQLGALEASAGEPNWTDVRRKARRIAARRLAVRAGTTALIGVTVVLTATPALGLRGQVVKLFSSGKPAPARVVEDFAELDATAPPGMAPGVIAGQAREVMRVPLSTGQSAVLRVAPTRAKGFCRDLSTSGPGAEGGGGCDSDRSLPFSRGLSIPGPISPQGRILKSPVVLDGDTLLHRAAKVEIRFQDGEVVVTPLVWVSPPIDAGFFIYEVPRSHWGPGHRPSALVVLDAAGRELDSAKSLIWPLALTDPATSEGEHGGLSVFSIRAGLREEWVAPGAVRIVTVGAGGSRATAVLTLERAPQAEP